MDHLSREFRDDDALRLLLYHRDASNRTRPRAVRSQLNATHLMRSESKQKEEQLLSDVRRPPQGQEGKAMDFEVVNATRAYLETHYPDMVVYVPDEVLSYGLPNLGICITGVTITTITSLITVTGNCLMIVLYIKHKTLRTPSNKLVINLAFSNLFMHLKSWVMIVNGIYGGPVAGRFGCLSFGLIGMTAGISEIWTITTLAYERCRNISTPLSRSNGLTSLTGSQINLFITSIWTGSLVMSALPLVGINGYVADTYLLVCTFDTWTNSFKDLIYLSVLQIFAWGVPLTIISACYYKIYLYTKGTRATLNRHKQRSSSSRRSYRGRCSRLISENSGTPVFSRGPSLNSDAPSEASEMLEQKLAGRLLWIIIFWVIGWTPYSMIAFVQMFGYGLYVPKWVSLGALLLCKVSSVINCLMYGLRLPKFKKKIMMMFSFLLPKTMCKAENSTMIYKQRVQAVIRHRQQDDRHNRRILRRPPTVELGEDDIVAVNSTPTGIATVFSPGNGSSGTGGDVIVNYSFEDNLGDLGKVGGRNYEDKGATPRPRPRPRHPLEFDEIGNPKTTRRKCKKKIVKFRSKPQYHLRDPEISLKYIFRKDDTQHFRIMKRGQMLTFVYRKYRGSEEPFTQADPESASKRRRSI